MAEALQALVESVVVDQGLDLEAVDIVGSERHRLLRVVVDADGGVGIDSISAISKALSHDLDESGLMGERRYTLEVTSRGVSSPLSAPRHWRRNTGRMVRAQLEAGGEVTGRILAADEESVLLDVRGRRRTIGYGDIGRAIVQTELNRPQVNREDS